MRYISFLFFLWIGSPTVFCQLDTLQARVLFDEADSLTGAGEFEKGRQAFAKAAGIFKQHQAWKQYYQATTEMGWNMNNLGQTKEAKAHFNQLLKDAPEQIPIPEKARLFASTAWMSLLLGQYDTAIYKGRIGANMILTSEGDAMTQSKLQNNLATIFYYAEKIDSAEFYVQKAIQIQKDAALKPNAILAVFYNLKANVYWTRGQYEKALSVYENVLAVQLEISGEKNTHTSQTYNNIGLTYYKKGASQKALDYYFKSLKIRKELFGENHWTVANTNSNIATAYQSLNELEISQDYHLKAINAWEAAYGERHPSLGRLYGNYMTCLVAEGKHNKAITLGKRLINDNFIQNRWLIFIYSDIAQAYEAKKEYETALIYQRKSLTASQQEFGAQHPEVAQELYNLADKFIQLQQYDSALSYYQQAIISNVVGFEEKKIEATPSIFTYSNRKALLNALRQKSNTLSKLHKSDATEINLKPALESVAYAEQIIKRDLKQNSYTADKVALANEAYGVYDAGIQLSQVLGQNNPDYRKEVFRYMEASKSVTLQMKLAESEARQFGDIPEELLTKELELKERITYVENQLYEAKIAKKEVAELENKRFILQQSLDSLITYFDTNYATYYQLKYALPIQKVTTVQAALGPDQALLEYFVGEHQLLYAVLLTKENYVTFEIPDMKQMDQLVNQFRQSLQAAAIDNDPTKAYQLYTISAHQLYQTYVQPALEKLPEEITKLTIITDGTLGYIPFELLLTAPADVSTTNYKNLAYLIKDYSISYAYSATLLLKDFSTNHATSSGGLLAYAPSYQDMNTEQLASLSTFRDQITPLVWNTKEAENISQYFEGKALLSANATEASFKGNAGNYRILHLAMHALVDDQNPMYSRLVFSQDQDSTGEDNYLNAYELYNLNLNADLAVLSACNTGYGKLVKGEGIMSLARGFAFAGCPSVVMSHWNVDDASGAKLMELFYQNLADGKAKSTALRDAQLTYLEEAGPREAHPFYWGNFVVIGKDDPLGSSGTSYWMIALIGVAVLGVGFTVLKRKSA